MHAKVHFHEFHATVPYESPALKWSPNYAARHDAALDEFPHHTRHGVWQISLFAVQPSPVKYLVRQQVRKCTNGLRLGHKESLTSSWHHQTVFSSAQGRPEESDMQQYPNLVSRCSHVQNACSFLPSKTWKIGHYRMTLVVKDAKKIDVFFRVSPRWVPKEKNLFQMKCY